MMPIGEGIGVQISKMKKLLTGFIMGVIITISEPDLQVLASQVPSVPNMVLILTVAKGIGESCGMHSEAQGIVMSLPVDSVAGI